MREEEGQRKLDVLGLTVFSLCAPLTSGKEPNIEIDISKYGFKDSRRQGKETSMEKKVLALG